MSNTSFRDVVDNTEMDIHRYLKSISYIGPGSRENEYLCCSLKVYDLSLPDKLGCRQLVESMAVEFISSSMIDAVLTFGPYTLIFNITGTVFVCILGKEVLQKDLQNAGMIKASFDPVTSRNRAELIDEKVYYLKGKELVLESMDIVGGQEEGTVPCIQTKRSYMAPRVSHTTLSLDLSTA